MTASTLPSSGSPVSLFFSVGVILDTYIFYCACVPGDFFHIKGCRQRQYTDTGISMIQTLPVTLQQPAFFLQHQKMTFFGRAPDAGSWLMIGDYVLWKHSFTHKPPAVWCSQHSRHLCGQGSIPSCLFRLPG